MTPPDHGDELGSPPPRSGWWMLPCLLLVSVAVHGGIIANTSVTARDSVGFARYARNLLDPTADRAGSSARTRLDVLREEKHPPGYPAMVAAVTPLVRHFDPAPPADQMLRATQVASAITAALLVFPAFWLAARLFDRTVAFWAVLLFQLLPVVARDTSDGLSDGPFLLFATASLAAGVGALVDGHRWRFLGCGVWSGCAYLVRPEGAELALAVLCVLILCIVTKRMLTRQTLVPVLAVAVGFLIVGGPYMLVIKGFTNKPAMAAPQTVAAVPIHAGPLFAESIPSDIQGTKRLGSAALVIGKEWLKATHYGVAVFALIGIVLSARRIRTEPVLWLPLVYVAGHLTVLMILGYKQGYVSERHLLPLTFVGTMFAVGGMAPWVRLWVNVPGIGPLFRWKHWPAFIVVMLALTCLPPLMRSLHDNRLGHKHAGVKLAEELNRLEATDPTALAGVVVIDHYEWAQFFAGRSLDRVPPDPPPEKQRIVYAVLELKDGKPERAAFDSDRHRAAVDLFDNATNPPEWVYTWPADAPRDQARVVLLKQVRK